MNIVQIIKNCCNSSIFSSILIDEDENLNLKIVQHFKDNGMSCISVIKHYLKIEKVERLKSREKLIKTNDQSFQNSFQLM